jgi:hypothetical protein
VFAVTLTAFVDAVAGGFHVVSLTTIVGLAPTCVTDSVLTIVFAPVPIINVTVPVLVVIAVFLVTLKPTSALPTPSARLTVNHVLLLVTIPALFEVTPISFVDALEEGSHEASFNSNVEGVPN